ncbi:LacI family transcriptional regulator [Rhodococcus opacus M213]|uniref:LacI family transcriptional regulator n=1 Tax=Rhodococcus opacus M213 TaxID=1129896 RepID=K8XKU4_RHOOP|nr:LacI family transcriptional regulator [Rhodococcus opacus M213]
MTTAIEPRRQPTRGQTRWAPQELPRWRPFTPSAQGGPAAADAAICTGATVVIAPQRPPRDRCAPQIRERGIRVPTDCCVVGFDDIFGSHLKQSTAPDTIGTARSRRRCRASSSSSRRWSSAACSESRVRSTRSATPADSVATRPIWARSCSASPEATWSGWRRRTLLATCCASPPIRLRSATRYTPVMTWRRSRATGACSANSASACSSDGTRNSSIRSLRSNVSLGRFRSPRLQLPEPAIDPFSDPLPPRLEKHVVGHIRKDLSLGAVSASCCSHLLAREGMVLIGAQHEHRRCYPLRFR